MEEWRMGDRMREAENAEVRERPSQKKGRQMQGTTKLGEGARARTDPERLERHAMTRRQGMAKGTRSTP
eukprot:5565001-Pleurochrysis_carterae.AAC.2